MKFHISHIFVVMMIFLSFYFIGSYGLDHTRYLGREVATLILTGSIMLIFSDVFNISISRDEGSSAVSTAIIFIVGISVIFLTLSGINSFLSGQEKKYLAGTLETTEGIIIGAGQRMNFSSMQTKIAFPNNNSPFYVFYKYSVKGKEYNQGVISSKLDNDSLRNLIKRKTEVKVKYSIRKPQVSTLELNVEESKLSLDNTLNN